MRLWGSACFYRARMGAAPARKASVPVAVPSPSRQRPLDARGPQASSAGGERVPCVPLFAAAAPAVTPPRPLAERQGPSFAWGGSPASEGPGAASLPEPLRAFPVRLCESAPRHHLGEDPGDEFAAGCLSRHLGAGKEGGPPGSQAPELQTLVTAMPRQLRETSSALLFLFF